MAKVGRYEGLQLLPEFPFAAYANPGLEHTPTTIAERFARAYRFLSETLETAPSAGLLILSAGDWTRHAAFPTYGLTHYDDGQRMVIAPGHPSTFWHPVIDVVGATSADLVEELRPVYGQPDGHIDLSSHIDLWVVHDLGHAFHLHVAYWFPRKWLMEFFADLCLYTYLATDEPDQLPALETFPHVMSKLPALQFRYRTLHDFEMQYNDMGLENYLWYHGHLFAYAKRVYEAAGIAALQRMWQAFVLANVQEVSDAQLAELLQAVHPDLVQMIEPWLP